MEFFVIITLMHNNEFFTASRVIGINPEGTGTRGELYKLMREHLARQFGDRWLQATVTFFSAEPNSLVS